MRPGAERGKGITQFAGGILVFMVNEKFRHIFLNTVIDGQLDAVAHFSGEIDAILIAQLHRNGRLLSHVIAFEEIRLLRKIEGDFRPFGIVDLSFAAVEQQGIIVADGVAQILIPGVDADAAGSGILIFNRFGNDETGVIDLAVTHIDDTFEDSAAGIGVIDPRLAVLSTASNTRITALPLKLGRKLPWAS